MRLLILCCLLIAYSLSAQERSEKQLRQQIFQKLVLSKTRCVVGEPIMATYTLYTRVQSSSKVVKRPGFKGFGVYDMVPPESGTAQTEAVNGELFSVYTLRKVQLYPLQAGSVPIESLEVENDVVEQGVHVAVPTKTAPQTITIDPLPKTTDPDFNGAVGSFSISSFVKQPENLGTQDLIELELTVTGAGNFPMLTAPTIHWPDGMVAYPVKINEHYDKGVMPIAGAKTFVFPFIVRKAGQYSIPGVRFSFFDPIQNRYVRTQTKPIALSVNPARPLEPKTKKIPSSTQPTQRIMGCVIFIMGILILMYLLRKKRKKPVVQPVVQSKKDENFLVAIAGVLADAKEQKNTLLFYQKINEGLDWLMYYRYEIVLDRWAVELIPKVQDDQLASLIKQLKDRAGLVLYTPNPSGEWMEQDYMTFMFVRDQSQ